MTVELLRELLEVLSEASVEIYNFAGPGNIVNARIGRVRGHLYLALIRELALRDTQEVTP